MVSKFYGWTHFVEGTLVPLTQRLTTPGTTFEAASGALYILRSNEGMKKLAGNWSLVERLFKAVGASHAMIDAVPDLDKRGAMLYSSYVFYFYI